MDISTSELMDKHISICAEARALMASKNHDYTAASGDEFANFRGSTYLGIKPELGVLLRMQDKMMRVKTFVEKGELKVKVESVKDTLIDLINYTVILYGLTLEERETGCEPATEVSIEGYPAKTFLVEPQEVREMFSGASAREYQAKSGATIYNVDGR